jgi:hypothetical protein
MFDYSHEPQLSQHTPLATDLLHLYDEVAEFNDCCAFLCDAFASLAAAEEGLDGSTAEGLRCLSDWMKQRMEYLKRQLKRIQEKASVQTQ